MHERGVRALQLRKATNCEPRRSGHLETMWWLAWQLLCEEPSELIHRTGRGNDTMTSHATPAHAGPEVLLVEGEPVAGLELPRHVVPAPLAARRVLASDECALRASLDGHVVAAVVDARADVMVARRAIAALRALPGGRDLAVVALCLPGAVGALRDEPRVDPVPAPFTMAAIHARLLLLAGAAARPEGTPSRRRSA
jgi:hypothetical protein